MLQIPKDIGMRSQGGYDTVPLDQAQRDDIDISNGYYMHARFDQNLTAGSFQGLLQRRGVGSSYMLNPTEHSGHGVGSYDQRQHVNGDHELNLDDQEGDQVCLVCYLIALTAYTLPAIHVGVVSRWRE